MEHAGVSGVQLPASAETDAYSNQVADASNQFCCRSRQEPSRKPCARHIEWYKVRQ